MQTNNFRESLRSPERSPKKYRPSLKKAATANISYVQPIVRTELFNTKFNIMRELNGEEIINQDKDIEIERLKVTCNNLNNKAAITDDLRHEV